MARKALDIVAELETKFRGFQTRIKLLNQPYERVKVASAVTTLGQQCLEDIEHLIELDASLSQQLHQRTLYLLLFSHC